MKNRLSVGIVGRHGYVGKHLIGNFRKLTEFDTYTLGTPEINYLDEVDSFLVMERFILSNNINYLINAVGYTGYENVDSCESKMNKRTTWELNVNFPTMLGLLCEKNRSKLINISSGCIFDGYVKAYTEKDKPNFGYDSERSSFYCKTKHICEENLKAYKNSFSFRIRMPFNSNLHHYKNYIGKILVYDKLTDNINSKTDLDVLSSAILKFIEKDVKNEINYGGPFHIVNDKPLSTNTIIRRLAMNGISRGEFKWITDKELRSFTKCNRSNCVLRTSITEKVLDMKFPSELDSLSNYITEYKSMYGENFGAGR